MHSSDLNFRKSSYSSTNRDCVEVADFVGGAAVRDTQNRTLGHLEFPTTEWRAFLEEVRCGDL
ncbi:DUF397 domain-containing protein [Nocardiopsis potens]|uniref:DUF397 domain-containing protein n=1 Tax=Nocardiopsis potens TaxID=1246458 RepID=UPI00034A31AF|nr:DUF397 domain-containing protein [Nocardiopsis potens]